ncbi:MAG: hypothetical protein ABIF09_12165, partial [Gemmatimonadota bacterium]
MLPAALGHRDLLRWIPSLPTSWSPRSVQGLSGIGLGTGLGIGLGIGLRIRLGIDLDHRGPYPPPVRLKGLAKIQGFSRKKTFPM